MLIQRGDSMLNYLWAAMILLGILIAAFTGKMPDVTNAVIDSAKEAISICTVMLGIVSMWMGILKIAEKSGLINSLSRKMLPLITYLFPDLPKNSKAINYISTNFIANFLGLGWAATPAGLKAMEELQKLNPKKNEASKSMCMFLIVNMSSLQLVTINIIAYRSQYGSSNPSEIIVPGIIATLCTTIAGIVYAKLSERGGE